MKKIVVTAITLGFVVALFFGAVGLYRYHHGLQEGYPSVLATITLWLWPTGLMLIDADENTVGFVVFFISAIANGLLYGLFAYVVATISKLIVHWKEPDDGWWPHG